MINNKTTLLIERSVSSSPPKFHSLQVLLFEVQILTEAGFPPVRKNDTKQDGLLAVISHSQRKLLVVTAGAAPWIS